ncbi:MAG TPA: Ger(x)C family spore germination protein [Symbiobacteriaceae bacterium]|nr:Ger(x)C family spore germination protein [Symbiobacteriaceae bacterium]
MRLRRMAAVLLALLMTLSGCWSRRELTEVSFAGLMGVDWAEGQYLITLNIWLPGRQGGERGGGGTPGHKVMTVTERGPSPDGALAKLDQVLPRSLTLAHVRAVIFGEEMARKGIGPVMDFLLRSVEIRPNAFVGIASGSAFELLGARPRQDIPAAGPLGYHDAALRRSSVTPIRRVAETANTLQEEGIDLTLPLFRRGNQPPPKPPDVYDEGALRESEGNADEIVFGGAGVFRGDKLVGWLTPDETRGTLWGTDQMGHGAISAECPKPEPDNRIIYRLRKGQGKADVELVGGKPRGVIRVNVVADVNDVTCTDTMIRDGDIRSLIRVLDSRVRANVDRAVGVMRETGADIFGFGQNLFRADPAAFLAREDQWSDIVREMPVTVQIDARVSRLGQLNVKYRWKRAE